VRARKPTRARVSKLGWLRRGIEATVIEVRARRTELTKRQEKKREDPKHRMESLGWSGAWKPRPSRGRVGPVAEYRSGVGVLIGAISHTIRSGAGFKAPHLSPAKLLVRRQLGWGIRPDLRVMGERGMRYVSVLNANSRWHGRCCRNAH